MNSWTCDKHNADVYRSGKNLTSSVFHSPRLTLIKHQIMACIWISYIQGSEEFFSAKDQAGNSQRGWLMIITACPSSPLPIQKVSLANTDCLSCTNAQFFHTSSVVSCIWIFLEGKKAHRWLLKRKKLTFPEHSLMKDRAFTAKTSSWLCPLQWPLFS